MKPDPSITDLLAAKRPLRSVEFFPPKDDAGMDQLRSVAVSLQSFAPDFVSVTYGAGGSTRERTARVCDMLRREFGHTVMPHLTCVGSTRAELVEIARDIHARGFRNIMALRGDPPKGESVFQTYKDGLSHGSDLCRLLHCEFPDICLGVGGYPEKHPEAPSMEADLDHLRHKVDQGAGFITTQLFFRNDAYFRFVDQCRARGITIPIIPGIMPVLSLKQIRRFTELCGSHLPAELVSRLEAAGEDSEAVEMAGVEWAAEQIRELLRGGAPGIHLYVLNRARAALALAQALS
jgi:methylenetetrahydrofolate reductase (NADPH)